MRILRVLEHEGQIFICGDKVKAVFDNKREVYGKIKWYGECHINGGVKDAIEIGKYCVAISDIKSISKL